MVHGNYRHVHVCLQGYPRARLPIPDRTKYYTALFINNVIDCFLTKLLIPYHYGPCQQDSSCKPRVTGYTDPTDPGAMQRLYIVCHTSLYEEQLYR